MHPLGRSVEEIVAEALKVIDPPSGKREEIRRELSETMHGLGEVERAGLLRQPSPGKCKERLETYLKNLLATKRTFVRGDSDDEFLKHLDAEIVHINNLHDFFTTRISKGSKPRDAMAHIAAGMACGSLPGPRRTLTTGGPWHHLSMLFYEAATGKPNCDKVLNYMNEIQKCDPNIRGGP